SPESIALEPTHEAYGKRVVRAKAVFPGGHTEEWTLRGEPVQVGFDWIRQPDTLGQRRIFRIWTPASARGLQFWRTTEGEQSTVGWHPGSRGKTRPAVWEGETDGVMLYSELPRAGLRLGVANIGQLRITLDERGPVLDRHEQPGPCWRLDWEITHGQIIRLEGNAGLRAATRVFKAGDDRPYADASLDFGAHYDQVLLGGLAYLDQPGALPRSACLTATEDIAHTVAIDEVALACESLCWCAPGETAELLRKAITAAIETPGARGISDTFALPAECSHALLLMMAGRYLRLTGDVEFICAHAEPLRSGANALLALRRPGEALPSFHTKARGGMLLKTPASSAVVHAGLSRWAAIEGRLGNRPLSAEYAEAAFAMQWAAIAPLAAGGLWHMNRNTFVHYRDAEGETPREEELTDQIPGSEFDFGGHVLAMWLGLCPDEDLIRRSYEWLDYTYTYASGRGGPDYPPGYRRTFHALLDISVRIRHACGDVPPILQRVLDTCSRAGLPFSRDVHGSALPAGMLLDNAPYFEIVLHRHYGLDYDAGGWRLSTPRPVRNYPLTRVTNLRHQNAVFAVTWQGRGTIQRVTINGAPLPSRVLDRATGEHEVLVTLG
ncbi:MAG: hypothetical protein RLZZ303_534, partial [Candidatus Hydrogenedentota bacterium]